MRDESTINVRYMVDDVAAAVDFYTTHFGFEVITSFPPAFADVGRGNLRLLLSGPTSSAGRPMSDGTVPTPGGWNRIHFVTDDLAADVDRLRSEGVEFRNEVVSGPGGSQTAGGACTVQAAFEEAAALGPADIHVPAGTYDGTGLVLSVPGDVSITGAGADATLLRYYEFTVGDAGRLQVSDLGTENTDGDPTFTVEGELALIRTAISNANNVASLTEGASVGVWTSLITGISPLAAAYWEGSGPGFDGDVSVYGSTLRVQYGRWGAHVVTGDAVWANTATAPWPPFTTLFGVTCDSAGLTSIGYNRTGWGCGISSVGDSTGLAADEFEGENGVPLATSPLVDAIPIGEAGCSLDAVDLYGNPRGVDGNGDGIPGCDIGAVERQP